MRSIGIDLEPRVKKAYSTFYASRPSSFGLEMHLVRMHAIINQIRPDAVIIDPISNLVSIGSEREVNSMLNRLIDLSRARE